MNLPERFSTTFQERWENFRQQLKTCRGEFSETAVHDLRVATRRLVACLEMAYALDPHPLTKKTQRALKEQIDQLDGLRDCQVMLVEISSSMKDHPEIAPLQPYLLAREQRLLRKARKQVGEIKLSKTNKRMEKILARLAKHLARPETAVELLQAVDRVHATMSKRFARIDAAQPGTIHRVRLSFKKFRYMVEILHPVLPEFPANQLKRMHGYQSMMGEVQDAESFIALLDQVHTKDPSFDPEPARRYFEQLRAQRITTYLDDKGELLVFWRPAAGQPFPWQNQSLS